MPHTFGPRQIQYFHPEQTTNKVCTFHSTLDYCSYPPFAKRELRAKLLDGFGFPSARNTADLNESFVLIPERQTSRHPVSQLEKQRRTKRILNGTTVSGAIKVINLISLNSALHVEWRTSSWFFPVSCIVRILVFVGLPLIYAPFLRVSILYLDLFTGSDDN